MKPFKEQIQSLENHSFNAFEVPGSRDQYWHFHPEIELTYVPTGSGVRCVGDHVSHYKSGDLVMVGKNVPHQWVCQMDGAEKEQRTVVIHFRDSLFKPFHECKHFEKFFENAIRGIYFTSPNPLIIKKIEALFEDKKVAALLSLIELVDLLQREKNIELLSSDKFVSKDIIFNSGARLEKAYSFINQNYTRQFSQNEISKHCNLTSSSFSRWFKKNTGSNFLSYVKRMRVSHAEQLLYMTQRQISEIAIQSGFESSSAFNRTFKQIKGMSPREFRRI